jgi:hypothetical protein
MRTVAKVRDILHVWTKAPRQLNETECYRVACAVDVVRIGNAKRANKPPRRASRLLETGRAFHRELGKRLSQAREKVPADIPPEIASSFIRQYFPEIGEMEEAETAAKAVVARCKLNKPDPANLLCDAVLKAWERSGVTVSEGNKPDDPLCIAVTALLALAGIHQAPATVSEILRGRSGRARSGGEGAKSAKKCPPDAK